MATLKSNYLGNLRTESVHTFSGSKLLTDAPVDNNGKGEAFSPTDLVCAALCTCMITVMGILAKRENVDLSGLSAATVKVMADNPRRIKEIQIAFTWNDPPATDLQKQKLRNAALTCPVALSLDPKIQQKVTFSF